MIGGLFQAIVVVRNGAHWSVDSCLHSMVDMYLRCMQASATVELLSVQHVQPCMPSTLSSTCRLASDPPCKDVSGGTVQDLANHCPLLSCPCKSQMCVVSIPVNQPHTSK
jgi:hypothetical protein